MTPSDIKPGDKFGNWEVIKYDHTNKHRVKYFLCKCGICGAVRPVRASALLNGTSTSCSKTCSRSIAEGSIFGNWTVLKKDKSQPSNYICRCKCGEVKSVFAGSLKSGASKSCGCLSRQHSIQKNKENAESHIGEKCGKLTILQPVLKGEGKNKEYYYVCQCECGNKVEVQGSKLFRGETVSCGCVLSKANMNMDKILTKYNIPFKREYRFAECKDKAPLPFDFALFNREGELIGLIENNGIQHYSSRGTGWNTPERLLYVKRHDYIKQKFAEDNRIPLLIIPYQYFSELEKFLITSDFWNIIIKNFND